MTAHPLVGIFGSTYAIVFGAFLFLVPFLMKKPLWSIPLANWTCGLLAVGTFTFWFAGFLSEYAPLYTLYWPLPADFTQFSLWGGTFFIVGIAARHGGDGVLRREHLQDHHLHAPGLGPAAGGRAAWRPRSASPGCKALFSQQQDRSTWSRCRSRPSPAARSTRRSTPASSCSPAC